MLVRGPEKKFREVIASASRPVMMMTVRRFIPLLAAALAAAVKTAYAAKKPSDAARLAARLSPPAPHREGAAAHDLGEICGISAPQKVESAVYTAKADSARVETRRLEHGKSHHRRI